MKQAEGFLTGVSERELKRLVPDILVGILPRIYPEMLAEVHMHQDAGRPTFIVSAAGDGIVRLLAGILDMDGGIGSAYELDGDGTYTGRLDGGLTYGPGKVKPMLDFAERHGIDLEESWAYSDAASDLPMLELVGHPVAVNPDAELARVAAERTWPVMRFDLLGRKLAAGAGLLAGATVAAGIAWAVSRTR